MTLLRSVVGKLWITILLLVSFVLFILTVMLLEFFQNYTIEETKSNLTNTAQKIARILEEHPKDKQSIGLEISWEVIDKVTKVVIIKNDHEVYYSPNTESDQKLTIHDIKSDPELSKVFHKDITVEKVSNLSTKNTANNENANYSIIGVPLYLSGDHGAVFIYQSLEVMKDTSRSTTKFIILVAGVAIVLTTIFAFFLSTRITAPLRKMREAAFEVARGKFDTKVPILTHDEIGELATAFNQMGRQLKFNMNALSQEKEQLSSILSSMADGVITFNRDGTILITNPPGDRFLQYWYYEKGDSSASEAIPYQVMELFQKAVETEKEQMGEISLQGRHWVILVTPLYSNQFIRGAVAVLRDMTEERQLEKMRKDFIANVSHELRTPISMLQGYSEAIVDDIAESQEEKKEMAKVIYDESLRMGRLVNELLDLARMEAGHIQLSMEEINLSSFINRIIHKFQGLAKDNEIYLDAEIEGGIDSVFLDPDRIEQVLTNLIDNAIRHTPKGGSVKLTVVLEEDKGVRINVKDSGTGIPEEDLPFVFERFYKADKARTRGKSGTGLGLAIAKNIIDAHKGTISVHSKLGQGTTFSFFIPRK